MKLSVIIPCYNAAETIGETLDAFVQQLWEEPWEIIVANNRSTDNSMPIVERYYDRLPNLRVIEAVERQGQPYALNTGAKAALGRSIAFCDADDVVGEGWVATRDGFCAAGGITSAMDCNRIVIRPTYLMLAAVRLAYGAPSSMRWAVLMKLCLICTIPIFVGRRNFVAFHCTLRPRR
jgi:glycosyltransferase involved in cell wall biosynthesis